MMKSIEILVKSEDVPARTSAAALTWTSTRPIQIPPIPSVRPTTLLPTVASEPLTSSSTVAPPLDLASTLSVRARELKGTHNLQSIRRIHTKPPPNPSKILMLGRSVALPHSNSEGK